MSSFDKVVAESAGWLMAGVGFMLLFQGEILGLLPALVGLAFAMMIRDAQLFDGGPKRRK